ncbi:MAG: hypothetical protein ACRDK7_06310 [Solirubrobacteraceae bacterium]
MSRLDAYDYGISLLMGAVAAAILVLGAPLWAIVLIYITGCSAVFLRHIDEFRVR